MKGIILAGGKATRLYPVTKVTSKHLLPIFNKPMIYYPLTTLIQAGIQEILIITTPHDLPLYEKLLGNGNSLGVEITYLEQFEPNGLAEAFIIGEEFIGDDRCSLILGDNLFFGDGLKSLIKKAIADNDGASLFVYKVKDPEKFGVIEFDANNNVKKIIEKPDKYISDWAVTGLYIYDQNAPQFAKKLEKSDRGVYEITDLNMSYLSNGNLKVNFLDESFKWLDTGSFDTLLEAANYVRAIKSD